MYANTDSQQRITVVVEEEDEVDGITGEEEDDTARSKVKEKHTDKVKTKPRHILHVLDAINSVATHLTVPIYCLNNKKPLRRKKKRLRKMTN